MCRHPAQAVGGLVATEVARQLSKLSELSQQKVFTIVMGHPVLAYRNAI